MTPDQASALIMRILGAVPPQRQRLSRQDVEGRTIAYTAGLIDLDYEMAEKAVDRCNKTSDTIPPIARIRREMAELAHGGQRSGAEAWGDVLKAVGRYGSDRGDEAMPYLASLDPLSAHAAAAVGWRAICQSKEDDPAPRAKFADAYNAAAARARKEAAASQGGTQLALPRERRDGKATTW